MVDNITLPKKEFNAKKRDWALSKAIVSANEVSNILGCTEKRLKRFREIAIKSPDFNVTYLQCEGHRGLHYYLTTEVDAIWAQVVTEEASA